MEGEADVADAGDGAEGLGPVAEEGDDGSLGEVEGRFTVFVFAEVEYLVYEAVQDAEVAVGYADEGGLLWRKVGGTHEAAHRLGDERERGAEVVGDVGEEHQFGLRSFL